MVHKKENVNNWSTELDFTILDISMKFEMSSDFITKLTETMVIFPEKCEHIIERLKGIRVLANYFFSIDNVVTQAYIYKLNWCIDNGQILEARGTMGSLFIPN